jgi:hypothetical protein
LISNNALLLVSHAWEDRHAQDTVAEFLSYREPPRNISEIPRRWLQMERRRVVDNRFNAIRTQVRLQCVAPVGLNYVRLVGVVLPAAFDWNLHHVTQQFVVTMRKAAPFSDPRVKIGQLDSQQRCLHLVKSAVERPRGAGSSVHQTMILAQGNVLDYLFVLGGNDARITESVKALQRMERK